MDLPKQENLCSSDLMALLSQHDPVIERVNYLQKDVLSGASLSEVIQYCSLL